MWESQQTGKNTYTIPSHLSVGNEETNRDGIALFGDVHKEHIHNSGMLEPDGKIVDQEVH